MRKITFIGRRGLLLLAAAALAGPAQAQVSAYVFAASAGTFMPLPATATSVPALRVDDATSGPTLLPLGFSFGFDGVAYTGVKACSNGFLSFNSNATYNVGNSLAGTAAASEKPLLAPLWDDFSGDASTSRASCLTTGTAPNRVFTFEWLNWKWSYQAPGPSLSFQVKLYEGSNRIEYVYQPIAGAPTAGPSLGASIGLAGMVPGTNPSQFLSLSNASAAPGASSATETTTIAAMPASGQTYAFVPGTGGGCGAPFNVGASAVTGTTASVAFQGPAAATGYVLTYQAAGGPVQTLTPAPMASPVTLSGLQPGTAYTVTVAAPCGAGQTSAATSATFTTAAGYCVTGLGGACGPDNILAVNIVGTTLNASGLTCTSAGTPPQAYASYPASGSTTGSIARGQSYQLSVTTGTTDIVSGWIDYDHSLTFDASE